MPWMNSEATTTATATGTTVSSIHAISIAERRNSQAAHTSMAL